MARQLTKHAPVTDSEDVVYEFFSPFAYIEGRYEWCRIRSPTHGVFDCFIVLSPAGTHEPATVYVASDEGEAFLRGRYPQCTAIRVPPDDLRLEERDEGRTVEGEIRSAEGPVRHASLTFRAEADALPRNVPYGGSGGPVWGNPELTCWGVDLVLDARVSGHVDRAETDHEHFDGEPALLTLGSFGRIAPRRDR